MINKWDKRLLELSLHVASWSKDPSTQVGAVVAEGNRIVSMGYNGFPQNVPDSQELLEDRETKYKIVLHAEENALLFAKRDLEGCTIYVTNPPCPGCAAKIIQSDVGRVVTIDPSDSFKERWGADFKLAEDMYASAGVVFNVFNMEDLSWTK